MCPRLRVFSCLVVCFFQHATGSGFGAPSVEKMEAQPERIVLSLVFNGKVGKFHESSLFVVLVLGMMISIMLILVIMMLWLFVMMVMVIMLVMVLIVIMLIVMVMVMVTMIIVMMMVMIKSSKDENKKGAA